MQAHVRRRFGFRVRHIFGGLVADAGNSGNTGSTGRIFEVVLTTNDLGVATKIDRIGDEVSLSWDSDPFASYVVEQSTDLKDWSEILERLDGNGEIIDWSETRNDKSHFYRVLGGIVPHEP